MGTTAPCSTGLANTGVLRLGNKCGRRLWSAVPIVCGCDVATEGGSGDCTNLRAGAPESGGRGRKKRIGTLRNGWEGSRILEIRWKEGRSTIDLLAFYSFRAMGSSNSPF